MDKTEREHTSGRHLAELGDATAALQAIVDAGFPIPSGYYLCTGKLYLPDERGQPAAGYHGISTLTHAEVSRAACGRCGTGRDWLAPHAPSLHQGVTLRCSECGMFTSHDELPGRPTSIGWEGAGVLVNGRPPAVVA